MTCNALVDLTIEDLSNTRLEPSVRTGTMSEQYVFVKSQNFNMTIKIIRPEY
jgi:hypothetical protein